MNDIFYLVSAVWLISALIGVGNTQTQTVLLDFYTQGLGALKHCSAHSTCSDPLHTVSVLLQQIIKFIKTFVLRDRETTKTLLFQYKHPYSIQFSSTASNLAARRGISFVRGTDPS